MARDMVIQNPEVLLENMILIRDFFRDLNITCFLHYGTLLGAIREKGFIPHDNDADLGMYWSDFDKVITNVPNLMSLGFSFVSKRNGQLLQFVRKNEQVDIFFAKKQKSFLSHVWAIDDRATITASYLDSLNEIDFLGTTFFIPKNPEKLMKNLYGKTWMIPMKDIPSRTNWSHKIKKLIVNPSKLFYYAFRFLNTIRVKYFYKKGL